MLIKWFYHQFLSLSKPPLLITCIIYRIAPCLAKHNVLIMICLVLQNVFLIYSLLSLLILLLLLVSVKCSMETWFSWKVSILSAVCSLHFIPGLQSGLFPQSSLYPWSAVCSLQLMLTSTVTNKYSSFIHTERSYKTSYSCHRHEEECGKLSQGLWPGC